jgi:hypothetical protein
MVMTERTMNDLRFATGLDVLDEEIPTILLRGRDRDRGQDERGRPPRTREDEIKFL